MASRKRPEERRSGPAQRDAVQRRAGRAQLITLITDFQSLIVGVEEHGCGLEAQLESWYHFLVQPDPWDTITLTSASVPGNPPQAVLGTNGTGVDATVLKMRHDFLRPDSLVAIIQVTNKEDSWSDPLWLGGYGWVARTTNFPGGPGHGAGPIGTSECDQPVNINTSPPTGGPNDPNCLSCAFPSNSKPGPESVTTGTDLLIGDDPNCMACAPGATTCPQRGWYTPAAPSVPITAADGVTVRYARQIMRQKYGFDSQFDYHRYVDGLTLLNVPDRNNESQDSSSESTFRNCTNPLFAASLPDGTDLTPATLCQLAPGPRTQSLVFYGLIGGVPNQLVTDVNGDFKHKLGTADWTAILGSDPDHYVFDGMDPHMIQSTAPRTGLEAPSSSMYSLGTDPDNGREWNTLTAPSGIDFQYACTFALPTPKDCTAVSSGTCDCIGIEATATDAPPLCDPNARTMQVGNRAYPSSRELLVAKALGNQSVAGSICAADTNPADVSLPTFGYHAVLDALVDRMAPAIGNGCLPQPLPTNPDGTTVCSMIGLYAGGDQAAGCTDAGMSQPTASMLAWIAANAQTLGQPVACVLQELTSCVNTTQTGWCYAAPGIGCKQSVVLDQHPAVPLYLMCPVETIVETD